MESSLKEMCPGKKVKLTDIFYFRFLLFTLTVNNVVPKWEAKRHVIGSGRGKLVFHLQSYTYYLYFLGS